MALTDPKNTLAYHQSRVFSSNRDMSDVPLGMVTEAVRLFLANDTMKQTKPEQEALWFYGMNHGVAMIQARFAPLEPLPPAELDFVRRYYAAMNEKSIRAFYYLLVICTREARHNKSLAANKNQMVELFGEPTAMFFKSINGGEDTIHNALLKTPPDTTIGNFVNCIGWQFYHSLWNGGYGGKAWGAVNDCLRRFVFGEFTAEMMMDTVWTLSHNNGTIFNKGHCYANANKQLLLRILDVQRSGQIPEMVLTDPAIKGFTTVALMTTMKEVASFGTIGSYVDWFKVKALGALGHYHSEQEAQKKANTSPEDLLKAKLLEEQVAKAKAEAEAAAQAKFLAENFQVMPGLTIKKIQRAA